MKVLAAVEDAAGLDAITSKAIAQLKPAGTEVRLLHVVDPFPVAVAERLGSKEHPDFEAARDEQRRDAIALLENAAAVLRRAGFDVSFSLEEGDVPGTIVEQADGWPADLIMIGSHGRGGLSRLLRGSVSDTVAHRAKCPVEIVPISERS
jgi:nucleotide-binding universal stress UspA family protein